MNKTKKNNKALWITLGGVLVLMIVVSVLENLNLWIPASRLPKELIPTSQLFTVQKKGAV